MHPPSEESAEISSSEHSLRQTILRKELKDWERSFASTNDGRKATRDEIKEDAGIAAKYKEYNYLRNAIAGKALPRDVASVPKEQPITPRKRKRSETHIRSQSAQKTSKASKEPQNDDQPSIALGIQEGDNEENSPPLKFVNATPQRDGRVLGLFDCTGVTPSSVRSIRRADGQIDLRSNLHLEENPLRRPTLSTRTPLTERNVNATPTKVAETLTGLADEAVQSTPSKEPREVQALRKATPTRHSKPRTPPSTGRRFLLNRVLKTSTPSLFSSGRKRKRACDEFSVENVATSTLQPSDANERSTGEFATPAFLRTRPATSRARFDNSLDTIPEESDGNSNGTPSKRTRTLQRANTAPAPLVSRFPGQRKPLGRSLSQLLRDIQKNENERLDEEQAVLDEMDAVVNNKVGNGHQDEMRVDEAKDGDKDSARKWKKRGQKRQTRKAILKPKPAVKPAKVLEETAITCERVHETRLIGHELHDSHATGAEQIRRIHDDGESSAATKTCTQDLDQNPGDEGKRVKRRKLNPLAHTNFTKLKMRGKGVKPKHWKRR